MEEERVKSALELAMERIAGMPELTPEEIAGQKEKECRAMGEALCNNYMQGNTGAGNLLPELQRHHGGQGLIVRDALVACLRRSIRFDDRASSEKAIDGLLGIMASGGDRRERVLASWRRLCGEYEQHRETLRKEFERAAAKHLADLGIAGSAVVPNINHDEAFTEASAGLCRSFEPRLEEFAKLAAGQ
ncbi:MAG TPA: hypothetical protein VLL97_11255 [Acidobacteriota bacterium]|nr:hypothetical protein [Acidobacteriota bacterium]